MNTATATATATATTAATTTASAATVVRFDLRFDFLFDSGRGLAFPCDESGQVDLETLAQPMRSNYLRARQRVGRDYSYPMVLPRLH